MCMRKLSFVIFINILLTAVLFEAGLQLIKLVGKNSNNPIIHQILQPPKTWEEFFVGSYMNDGTLVYTPIHQPHPKLYVGIYQPHPTRGWSIKPLSTSAPSSDTHYTSNRQGYRALYDFANKPDKYQVLIVGDSFTFGDEVDDRYTWPHLLQQQNSNLNVFNMAGTGYGTDQMLITLEEEISTYRPDLVIAAFIEDDLHRSTLPFRDYKKPRFLLSENGALHLSNTPIGSIPEVLNEIADKGSFSYSPIQSINLLNILTHKLTPMGLSVCSSACWQLNTAIFEKMQKLTSEYNGEFLMIYLPHSNEILNFKETGYGEVFFEQYHANHSGNYLNPRPQFVNAGFKKARFHYQKDETSLLSQLVMQRIASLKSWKCKQRGNAECKLAKANP
jgi:hypothetical protein